LAPGVSPLDDMTNVRDASEGKTEEDQEAEEESQEEGGAV
jgi:hypothetical protein